MYIDKVQHAAFCRMTQHDMLPAHKRSFAHNNSEYFADSDIAKYDLATLRKHRPKQIAKLMKRIYGPDHPSATKGERK